MWAPLFEWWFNISPFAYLKEKKKKDLHADTQRKIVLNNESYNLLLMYIIEIKNLMNKVTSWSIFGKEIS